MQVESLASRHEENLELISIPQFVRENQDLQLVLQLCTQRDLLTLSLTPYLL